MRNLKTGMVLAAMLAISAIGAAGAQAGSLDVGAAPAWLTGSQGAGTAKAKLAIKNSAEETLATVKCTNASITATTSTLSVTETTVTPSYGNVLSKECELSGLAATVRPGSCKYTLSGVGSAANVAGAQVTSCTSVLEIEQGTCILTVASSTSEYQKLTFTSTTGLSPDHVTADLEVKNIALTGDSGCPSNLVGTATHGELTGSYTVKAFSDVNGVEGAQVSLTST